MAAMTAAQMVEMKAVLRDASTAVLTVDSTAVERAVWRDEL